MNVDTGQVRQCLKSFDFKRLFIQELNWSHCTSRPLDLEIDGDIARINALAELGGVVVYQVELLNGGEIPSTMVRRQIENKIKQMTHEHIIIFVDANKTKSVWQWVRRGSGFQTATREHTYYKNQPGDSLLVKLDGIAFDISELGSDGNVKVMKVVERVKKAFDVEKVTRRFYDEFKTEHSAFCQFLKGLDVPEELSWYASVMLNRLMFIYFVQKKGFLNGDTNYLANKLKESKKRGADQFYKRFLIRLFFEGFAKEEKERSPEVNQLLGKVPYLNGGLFLPHQLEVAHGEKINIGDYAFERLFDFFDRYSWHLDYRPLKADNEINPDVLGYIFEKYINQKQMGAYYTKEDITDYICKNTIIPFLFDKLENMRYEELHPFPMKDVEPYIYDAVKTKEYLPTETEREYQARQKRYQQIKDDFAVGKITSINDLITYNLDIRQFAEDWVASIHDPVTLRAFYFHCLTKVTVLDPAAGSGAFLFAALNMLEPLYEICLDKMEELGGPKYQDFAEELARVNKHPNRKYFVLKSIIVNNLYGVDIMEEAVEICKLRLFLKLVAQVDDVSKIEPLPDIDFNIRAGNSLVGYANEEEVKKAKATQLDLSGALKGIEERIGNADRALKAFRDLQTRLNIPASELAKAKAEVKDRLAEIQTELDRDLAAFYGARDIRQFVKTHQPFHWFVEFYGIIKDGGFDVIIGNPPYVEYTKVKGDYTIKGYKTERCGDTYAFFCERNSQLVRKAGRSGMIIPHSSICTDRMAPVQELFKTFSAATWISTYCIRPSKLFVGVDQRLAIYVSLHGKVNSRLYSSRYHRWHEEFRPHLFSSIQYEDICALTYQNSFPKAESSLETKLWYKMARFSTLAHFIGSHNSHTVYYHNAPRYWIRAMDFIPYFWNERDGEQISTQVKIITLQTKLDASVVVAVLNSSLFYWWFILLSDCRHLNIREIERFPLGLDRMEAPLKQRLTELTDKLMQDLKDHSQRKEAYYKATGKVVYDEFYPKYSKPIIDEIDRVLARHYGFTEEELDFIINYDIKYRMGKDNGEEEDI
jgi:hypothetical protein